MVCREGVCLAVIKERKDTGGRKLERGHSCAVYTLHQIALSGDCPLTADAVVCFGTVPGSARRSRCAL